jgi:hypothetical protein
MKASRAVLISVFLAGCGGGAQQSHTNDGGLSGHDGAVDQTADRPGAAGTGGTQDGAAASGDGAAGTPSPEGAGGQAGLAGPGGGPVDANSSSDADGSSHVDAPTESPLSDAMSDRPVDALLLDSRTSDTPVSGGDAHDGGASDTPVSGGDAHDGGGSDTLMSGDDAHDGGGSDASESGTTLSCGIEQQCCAGGTCSGDLVCAGQVCHCVAFIEGNYYVRGDGSVIDARTATQVPVLTDNNGTHLVGVRELAEGSNHACGRLSDNTVWCWGSTPNGSQNGQLGNGSLSATEDHRAHQVQVAVASGSPPAFLTDVRSLSHPGDPYQNATSCAVKNDGTVWCWGVNAEGYLFSNQPQPPSTQDSFPRATQIMATPYTALSGVDQISVGVNHACALRSGAVYCWGRNYNGALGLGDTNDRVYATLVQGLPTPVTKISASFEFTCALAGGKLYCWGMDLWHQLGDLGSATKETGCTTVCRRAPGPGLVVLTNVGQSNLPIDNVKDFFLGDTFTVAILADNSIRYFGNGLPTQPTSTDLPGIDNLWQVSAWGAFFPDAARYITRDALYFVGKTMRYPVCQ